MLNETFFKIFLIVCLVPAILLIGKAFVLLSPIIFWVLSYMAYKKENQNEAIMWVIFAILEKTRAEQCENKICGFGVNLLGAAFGSHSRGAKEEPSLHSNA